MSDKPKLIGIITAPLPKLIKDAGGRGVHDFINRIAFSDDGRAWGLVVRQTPLEKNLARMTLHRFQLLADVPFVETDAIEFFDGKKTEV